MEGLSERAYAERSGLSRGAVQKARKNGRLVLFADGSINAVASDARRGAMTDPDQQMRSRGGVNAGGDSAGLGASGLSGPGESTCYLKARTALPHHTEYLLFPECGLLDPHHWRDQVVENGTLA
ncbi:hypothetical protein C7964_11135 [Loktanella sp. PT4BL]|jgi:hypothetical protein|nr:hypothetical protein C7964_11135 [Loktanella sp. PT4BL]